MKRYLVFAYDYYYPSGGSSEVEGEFNTLEELKNYNPETNWDFRKLDNIEILDLQERRWLEKEEFINLIKFRTIIP